MKGLRKRLYKSPEVGELARDVDDALQSLVHFTKRRMVTGRATATAPIYMSLPAQPYAILAVRGHVVGAPLTLVQPGAATFEWNSARGHAVISTIPGVVSSTLQYEIDFLVVS